MKTSYSYDALGRVLQARYADGTATTYQYDQGANGIGHLTKLTDSAGVTTWTYDQKGRVATKTQQTGGRSFVTRMSYDNAGRLASLQYPSGKTISYSYDAAGRVSGISLGRKWLISNITYRPFGPVQSWKQGNGANVTRAYDMDGQLTGITVSGIGAINYTYDAAGHITATTETGQPNQAYAYDALDRLTHYNAGGVITAYSYDADGNRLGVANSASTAKDTYNYTPANNRLMSVVSTETTTDKKGRPQTKTDTDTFTYDAVGNTLSDGENVYAYDARGRMSGAGFNLANFRDQRRPENDRRKPRLGVKYDINGLGQRVAKHGAFIHPQGHVYYVYDEASHLIGEYDARGNVIEETVYLGNLPIAVLDETGCGFGWGSFGRSSPSVHYITPDNLGAPHIITDSNNKKVWQWNHEPFGNTEPVTATNRSGFFGGGVFGGLDTGFTYDLRFPGQIYDPETGLNYNMARDYNSALGRYVQSDPIGLRGGVNSYGYATQNPISNADPDGLCVDPGGNGVRYCIEEYIPEARAWGFDGDNRGPMAHGGSFRAQQLIWFNGSGQVQSSTTAGVSRLFGFDAQAGNQGPHSVKGSTSCGETVVNAINNTSNGYFQPGIAPYAWYNLTIRTAGGSGKVSGQLSPFPNLEVWQYGIGPPKLLYSYGHGSYGPSDINGPPVTIR